MPITTNQIRIALDEVLVDPSVFDYCLLSIHQVRSTLPVQLIANEITSPLPREDFIATLLSNKLNTLFGLGLVHHQPYQRKFPDIMDHPINPTWALEAKHYSPHQSNSSNIRKNKLSLYLKDSLAGKKGPVVDVNKLISLGIPSFHILQLQTEIIYPTTPGYSSFVTKFGFVKSYIHPKEKAPYTLGRLSSNMNVIVHENRIVELVEKSRELLDPTLIYGSSSKLLNDTTSGYSIGVCIHYLISQFPNQHFPVFPYTSIDINLLQW